MSSSRIANVRIGSSIAILLLLLATGFCSASDAIPLGKSKLEVEVGGHKIDLFTYKPFHYKAGPLVVVFHGLNRNADTYLENSCVLGDQLGAIVVAPRFDLERFSTHAYQAAGLFKDGKLLPREEWTVSFIPQIVDEIRRRERSPDKPYYLIGHSAGGQFVERLAAMTPSDAKRIVATNPGSHIFPTRDVRYPHGFGGLPEELSNNEALKRYLAQPLTLYLGTADTGKKNLPDAPAAVEQGVTRYERGKNCFHCAEELAKKNGWAFNWRLVEAPGIDHSSKDMFASPQMLKAIADEAN